MFPDGGQNATLDFGRFRRDLLRGVFGVAFGVPAFDGIGGAGVEALLRLRGEGIGLADFPRSDEQPDGQPRGHDAEDPALFAEAETIIDHISRQHPGNRAAEYLKARVAALKGEFSQAEIMLEMLLKSDPTQKQAKELLKKVQARRRKAS